jgi:transcriptional regulator
MHVDREKLSAKFWLDPDVRIAENLGYGRQELRAIERIAREKIDSLRSEWDDFCGSNTDTR